MGIHESSENYLETILMLSEKNGNVRSVDIANELGFKKSSISVAMKNLRNSGHIIVNESGYILLTERGRRIAEMIYERHRLFTIWLMALGVDEKTAAKDACRLEHAVSEESFSAIKNFINHSDCIKKELQC